MAVIEVAHGSAGNGDRDGRRLLSGVLVVGAVVSAVNIVARPLTSAEFEVFEAVLTERDRQWWFGLVGGVAAGCTYASAGLATWLLVRSRGVRWARVGALATALGAVLFAAGFFAFGAVNWYLTSSSSAEAVFAAFRDDPARVFAVQAVGFLLSVLGVVLLAVALWRAGCVPRWLSLSLGVAPVLMVTLGDAGRLYDGLYAIHMATLVALGVRVWPGRPGSTATERSATPTLDEPAFRGVDHLAFTVTDVERSRRFYVDVLGFTAVLESPNGVLCVHKGTAFTLGLVRHDGGDGQPFTHLRTGLDHLGLMARDRAELEAWRDRLCEHDVPFSGITDEALGHHLNLRDPDGIALELYAPNAAYAAAREELRSRAFTDAELRTRAVGLLGLDDSADTGRALRIW